MKPSTALKKYRKEIREIVEQHHTANPRIFGSVLNGEDTTDSDLDLLVEPTSKTTLFDIAKIQNELQKLLRVTVDVLTPNSLPENFRNKVLQEAIPV